MTLAVIKITHCSLGFAFINIFKCRVLFSVQLLCFFNSNTEPMERFHLALNCQCCAAQTPSEQNNLFWRDLLKTTLRNSFHRSISPNSHAFQSNVSVIILKRTCQDLLMRSRKIGEISFQLEFKNSWVSQGAAPSTGVRCTDPLLSEGPWASPCCSPWA